MKNLIYDRSTKTMYEEKQYKIKQLNFLYNTFLGRILLKFFISTKLYSILNAKFYNCKKSTKKIKPFIDEYNIDMGEFERKKYISFNDFFIRKIKSSKRPFSKNENDLISVADSKLLVYKIGSDTKLEIKNSIYTIDELLHNKKLSTKYENGTCLIFRLTVDDYHRYCFFDDGKIKYSKKINGRLHTVCSISNKRFKVYSENSREYNLLVTRNFGEVVQIEVGALLVGKIVNKKCNEFKKGHEKGYFCFGGSTIILLFKKNTIQIDNDIIEHSSKHIESRVKLGEKIGVKLC